MSMLAALSRRFQILTTDAKPDPPRIVIEGPGPNPDPELKQKSAPVTPEPQRTSEIIPAGTERQRSKSNTTIPEPGFSKPQNFGSSGSSWEESRPKSPRAKTKSKYKKPQGANVVNYNIISSNGVKIGSKTTYICNVNQYTGNVQVTPEGTSPKPETKPMPQNVEELSSCKKEISIDDMFVIKTHIGHGWRDVARRLGYSEGQIEQFEENEKSIDQVVYKILLDWKQANTKDAQLGSLVCIMWSCQEYECVERLVAARQPST